MVIFGGLELVAAGVIFHKYNKGKEQERELEREQNRRSRERRHERKHHHRRESPPQHSRKDNNLYPPQSQAHRAHSAPPPEYAPNWQSQPTYYPPQSWQPQQNEKAPAWHPRPGNYPPTWQAPAQAQSQQYPYPQSQPYAHPQPPQTQPQPQPSMHSAPHHDDTALSDILQRGPPNVSNQPGSRTQPRPTAVAPPDPNYAELSADNPRNRDTQPSASPHLTFTVPGDGLRNNGHDDPPPAYQDCLPERRD